MLDGKSSGSGVDFPMTESVKYAGSKLKLLPQILELIQSTGGSRIFDGFAGSTRVGQALARSGFKVVSNDVADWSFVLGSAFLLNKRSPSQFRDLICHLNKLPPEDGWFTQVYGGDVTKSHQGNAVQQDGFKRPWQRKNTRKLDAIRREISELKLDQLTRNVALTSLMLALDQVDNSLGHFSSYLRNWSPRSYKDLELKVPSLWINEKHNQVLQKDVFDAIQCLEAKVDVAYLDPPYGSNNEKMPPSRVRYAAYYHLWTTICRNDQPDTFGKVSRRKDSSDKACGSVFEEYRKNEAGEFIAVTALDRLIERVPCEWILLSYSSGGRATSEALHEVIGRHGKLVHALEARYKKNVMASMKWTHEWLRSAEEPHREFLFLIRK